MKIIIIIEEINKEIIIIEERRHTICVFLTVSFYLLWPEYEPNRTTVSFTIQSINANAIILHSVVSYYIRKPKYHCQRYHITLSGLGKGGSLNRGISNEGRGG